MAFGMSKLSTRRRDLSVLPDDWVACLEPGVEVEGNLKAASGCIRLNTRIKGDIVSEGALVLYDQGEVEGNIEARVVTITGKVKGNVYAKERLEIKEHGSVVGDVYTSCLLMDPGGFFEGQCHMPAPEPATQSPKGADSQNTDEPAPLTATS
jgi:cytoskeletal protein CcmA (bactofilin family)